MGGRTSLTILAPKTYMFTGFTGAMTAGAAAACAAAALFRFRMICDGAHKAGERSSHQSERVNSAVNN